MAAPKYTADKKELNRIQNQFSSLVLIKTVVLRVQTVPQTALLKVSFFYHLLFPTRII
jgi:hypothetical protein